MSSPNNKEKEIEEGRILAGKERPEGHAGKESQGSRKCRDDVGVQVNVGRYCNGGEGGTRRPDQARPGQGVVQ
jgi:hypothetical protein